MRSDLHGALGLAQRAGRICSGQDVVRQNLAAKKVFLLLLASDASKRTYDEFVRLAEQGAVPWRDTGTMQEYGDALGKPARAVVAVLDKALAQNIVSKIDKANHAYGGG